MPEKPITRYGWNFDPSFTDLEIELEMIAKGGDTFPHYMNARKLLWPDRYRHRWTDLMYRSFIDNDLTVLMGCASSQKTSHAVEYALISYWTRPTKTLVILSSLNMEKMDIGVWAELKTLWQQAIDYNPELAGHLVEYKRAIATDNIEETARDFRKGCICRPCYVGGKNVGHGVLAGAKQEYVIYVADECFPAGTMVDTPLGRRPIEDLEPGDMVISAYGCRRIVRTGNRFASSLVSVSSKDGRRIVCTPDHKIFTNLGWQKACNLSEKHYMLSPYETMSVLQQRVRSPHQTFLHRILCLEMGSQQTGDESLLLKGVEECSREESRLAEATSAAHDSLQSHAQSRELRESSCGDSLFWNFPEGERRERDWSYQGRMAAYEDVPRCGLELRGHYGYEAWQWISSVLQTGLGLPEHQIGDRSRWSDPFKLGQSETKGREERQIPRGAWVDRVEVLEQTNSRFQEPGSNCGRCRVYNLEVEGHPSYSVNGFVVHNCQFMAPAFSASWPHLFSNPHVKIITAGNPKHDPEDELSKVAEPKEGWASIPEPEKTETWDTKFMGGKCLNFVGTDSPNFDVPEGAPEPYPRLIGRKFAKRIAQDSGPDSFEFYRLVKGVMKMAFAKDRVITRQLCRGHKASEQAVWVDDKQTWCYGLDPTYGGEDRCVGTPMKFGEDVDGKQVLQVFPYKVFQFNLRREDVEVEDQIAEILEKELELYGIPIENCGYDATGKGTLGAAFAKRFGKRVPIAIDSGAMPTRRPVRSDLFVDEPNGTQRLKRCEEHYSKFVSEMWFAWRYAIMANQMRGLLPDVIGEGCARIYYVVGGNKIEVEPKIDPKRKENLKRRLGKSPDLADSLVIGIERARQLGFTIGGLGPIEQKDEEKDWFETEAKEYREAIQDALLTHA